MYKEYEKTENLFERGEDGIINILKLKRHEFNLINKWFLTEKLDGTNTRLVVHDNKFHFMGRRKNSSIVTGLKEYVMDAVDQYAVHEFPEGTVIFGEGIGYKVNGNRYKYNKDEFGFFVFDVYCNGMYLEHPAIAEVADHAGFDIAPVVGMNATLATAMDIASQDNSCINSSIDGIETEGVVGTTEPYLYDRYGRRIKWKLKRKDIKALSAKSKEDLNVSWW